MKRLAILVFYVSCVAIQVNAQTFTQHIQQKQPGKGSVTVTQSKEIDNLVNGVTQRKGEPAKPAATATPSPPAKPSAQATPSPKKTQQDNGQHYIGQPMHSNPPAASSKEQETAREEERKKTADKAAEEKRRTEAGKQEAEEEMSIPTVDMRKKVMRNARKVTGYRVQAYAGGNTRADKQRAQHIGDAIKMKYPEQPIYVHFYSPRWICRVGNFRSYGEASKMLKAVKAMGYKGATIVKGKITVFD